MALCVSDWSSKERLVLLTGPVPTLLVPNLGTIGYHGKELTIPNEVETLLSSLWNHQLQVEPFNIRDRPADAG